MKDALILLDQILECAQAHEKEINAYRLAANKAKQTVGESALLYHLKTLKELLESKTDKFPIQYNLDFTPPSQQ